MSQVELFRILEIIVRKYSKTPVRFLMEHYLRIKLIYSIPLSALDALTPAISLGALAVFTKRNNYERKVNFSCLIIDHPKLLPLTSKLLQQIECCIVLDENMNPTSNILGKYEEKESLTKAIIFRSQRQSFESLSESLDSYLSICEVFHSHIHLTFNCFEAPSCLQLAPHMQSAEGDEFEGIMEEGYFRLLEERGSKITLEELSEVCEIERLPWGEMLVFEGGHDGLIVWVTQRFLPKLQHPPNIVMPSARSKQYLLFRNSDLGFKIFKRRQLFKEPLHELRLTTVIFNLHSYQLALEKMITCKFDDFCKSFFSEVLMKTETALLEEYVRHGERICDILAIERKQLLQKLLQL